MTRRRFVAAGLALAAPWRRMARAQGYTTGVFVGTPQGPVELIAYADRIGNGQLRMSYGTFEDVPAIGQPQRLLCNLPGWRPELVWLSTRRIFRDEFAERRTLPFAVRPLTVAAIEVRVRDVEDPARRLRLLRAVGASGDNAGYLFLTMSNGGVTRDYMLKLLDD